MEHILDPREIDDPQLREIGIAAARVAKLEETGVELEGCLGRFLDDELEPFSKAHESDEDRDADCELADLWRDIPHSVAITLVHHHEDQETVNLRDRVTEWLAANTNHWDAFRDLVFAPWQMKSGKCHSDTPRWVLVLGGLDAVTLYGQVPYEPRPWVAYGQIVSAIHDDDE